MSIATICVQKGGLLSLPGINPASTRSASDLLASNHRNNHIFWNSSGYHNHVAHHILALYDCGAQPATLQAHYRGNLSYQRPPPVPSYPLPGQWETCLGNHDAYASWLVHFSDEIRNRGCEAVLNDVFFSGTERADDMLVRLFAGFAHPFIHIGYGLEFGLSEIVAEGCAMAAISHNWLGQLFFGAENLAAASGGKHDKRILDLLAETRQNERLRAAAHWEDDSRIKGILQRAPNEILSVLSQFNIGDPSQIWPKLWESFSSTALFCGAAQREEKEIRIDFYLLHGHNASLFLPTFVSSSWLSDNNKVRLLEWKVRHDITLYASRRAPDLSREEISEYRPKEKVDTNPWLNLIDRAMRFKEDDGHLIKFVRTCAYGVKACPDVEGAMSNDMWVKLAQMAVDSVEKEGRMWVHSTGFDEAWEEYGPRVTY